MADNVYLLATRLSPAQQKALEVVRGVARDRGLTIFLVGGAVRDLISGSPVRDLDFAVQGNALELREQLEQAGAVYSGEASAQQSLYMRFPSGVRLEVGSTLSASFPKPGKAVYEPTSILDDLRRRDFTANAMALSLNDGSYGLLMDPLNGVADIENRELRLVSNYGFIEDPVRLLRAARFMARLGWQMDERTRGRYELAKEENYIAALQPLERSYELEELFHEEEPVRAMRRLEEEGWLKALSPVLSVGKVNTAELSRLREAQILLETRGIRADAAAANFPLLTGKLSGSELEAIKKSFPRRAFVTEIESLEGDAKDLGAQLMSKAKALPSEAYKLILFSDPVVVLWLLHSSKNGALQAKFKSFASEWPQAQAKMPFLLMAEMRITPDLPEYEALQEKLFYALMDGRLSTTEEMKAFLEPYSPPAPPPVVPLRRPRAPKKEAKAKKKAVNPVAAAAEQLPTEPASGPPADPAMPAIVSAAGSPNSPKPAKKSAGNTMAAPVVPSAASKASEGNKPEKKIAKPSERVKKAAAKQGTALAARAKSGRATAVSPGRKPAKATPSGGKKLPTKKAVPTSSKKATPPANKKLASAKAKVPSLRKGLAPPKKHVAKTPPKKKSTVAKKAAPAKRVAPKKALKRR